MAGWGFVVLDDEGKWLWTAKGTFAGPNCSSFRAELNALLEALRATMPPVTIYVDNKAVVDGVQRGERWCTASGSSGADLWREIWGYLRELKGQEVQVVKVKAHTSWWDVLEGRISHREHVGNSMADKAAKEATAAAERLAPTATFSKQLQHALSWLKWILKYTVEWTDDVEVDVKEVKEGNVKATARTRMEGGGASRVDGDLGHELWSRRGQLECRRCGCAWEKGKLEETVGIPLKCKGCSAGRAAAQATGNMNYIWTVHAKSEAAMCEEGAKLLNSSAPPGWLVDQRRLYEAADSKATLKTLWRRAGLGRVDEELCHRLQQGGGKVTLQGGGISETDLPLESIVYGGQSQEREGEMPWQRAPDWMPISLIQPFEKQEVQEEGEEDRWRRAGCARIAEGRGGGSHALVVQGPIAYCTKCARFALERVGSGLKGRCFEPLKKTGSAVQARLNRLRAGLHPLTGRKLDQR